MTEPDDAHRDPEHLYCGPGCGAPAGPPTPQDTDRVMRLLCLAIDGESERCCDLLEEISAERGPWGIYETCCALAGAVVELAQLKPVHAAGEMVIIDTVPEHLLSPADRAAAAARTPAEDAAALRSARFVAAYANDDHDTCTALFESVDCIEDAGLWVIELLGMAGSLGRARQEENRRSKG